MSNLLFEEIEKQGLVKKNKVNIRKIMKLSKAEIIDFSNRTMEITSSEHTPREKSPFAFSASLSMTGGVQPCAGISCRLRSAKEFAQYAALYSDRIYIDYYPSDYDHYIEDIELDYLQERLANDLFVLSYLRPLIADEKIIPLSYRYGCPRCLAKKSFGQDADKRFDITYKKLLKRYKEEVTIKLEKIEGELTANIEGSELLIEHGNTNLSLGGTYIKVLEKEFPEILRHLDSEEEVTLSPKEIRKLHLDGRLASPVIANLYFELATTQSINTNFLTNRDLDIEILSNLSGKPEIEERNQLIRKYLTCFVPFIENASPEELLKIRKGEEDSLIIFRKGLNQAIDEYSKKNEITEKEAREIYGDIIEPKIAQLNIRVEKAKQKMIKETISKVLGWTGAISLGWYAGFIPNDLVTAASVLGLVNVVAEITENALAKSKTDESIQEEPMYYLWKVKKKLEQ